MLLSLYNLYKRLGWSWKEISSKHQIICRDAGAGGYQAFPDICKLTNGDLLSVFYAGYSHVSKPCKSLPKGGRICGSISLDNGKSWSAPFIVVDTDGDDNSPHVSQLSDGRIICTFNTWVGRTKQETRTGDVKISLVESKDFGNTWSEPHQINLNSDLVYYVAAPVRELTDGSLILGLYHENPEKKVAFGASIKSYDGGKTWTDLVHIGEGAGIYLDAETNIIQLSDGNLLAVLRAHEADMHYSFSKDLGKTWSKVKSIGFPGHSPCLLLTSKGILLLAHRIPYTALHYSFDEGRTWDGPIIIDTVIGAYPGLVELDDGKVLAVYYEEGKNSKICGKLIELDEKGIKFKKINLFQKLLFGLTEGVREKSRFF